MENGHWKSHLGDKGFPVISLEPAGHLDSVKLGKAALRTLSLSFSPSPKAMAFALGPLEVSLTLFWPHHAPVS